jgi:HK97 gp10 family phage protein
MSIEISIGGLDELRARLAKLASADQMESALTDAAQAGAMVIEGYAKTAIMAGPKTGETYGRHQASAPGEAPATDTGHLVNSIQTEALGGGKARVFVGAEYGAALEYGTAHIAPRPYMRPAADDHREEITQAAAAQLSKAIDEVMG